MTSFVGNSFIGTDSSAPLQASKPNPKFTHSAWSYVAVINTKRYSIVEFEVDLNAHGATDSGSVTLAIGGNPDFSVDLFRGDQTYSPTGPIAISNDAPVYIELFAGPVSNPVAGSTSIAGLTSIFFGIVDLYTAQFSENKVQFSVRSLGAPLVDDKITRISQSETTVQFVQAAAAQYGLQAVTGIIGAPLTIQEILAREYIGGYNFAASLYGMKYWDLIIQCCLFEDVDAWVDQGTLYFIAPSLVKRNTVQLEYGRDFAFASGFVGTHAPQFNKNIEVRVHTYQRKTKLSTSIAVGSLPGGGTYVQPNSHTVSSNPEFGTNEVVSTNTAADGTVTQTTSSSSGGKFTGGGSPGSESGKEIYNIWIPNLSPAASTKRALAEWRQISQHEYQVDMVVPVTTALFGKITRTSLLQVSGCPYLNFDGLYYPRQITMSASAGQAFRYRIKTVSHVLPSGAV